MYQDPLLNNKPFSLPELERQQEALQKQLQQLQSANCTPKAPTWDEIDRITSSLSDKEYRYLESNEEFKESSVVIQSILQREYMKIMRPIVEQTKDGKDALDKHLTLLKRLIKTVKDEADQREALMNEYITEHSDMTWQEFMEMKQGKKKGGKR